MTARGHRTSADLRELLEAVDLCYFKGQLDDMGVEIRWMPASGPKGRAGQYWPDTRMIEVSRSLASLEVPLEFIMGIIYHEALHAVLGPDHGPVFRMLESRYLFAAESHLWEMANYTRPWPSAPKGLR